MTVGSFLRLCPLIFCGSLAISYATRYDCDQRAFWAILGSVSILLAGILLGLFLASSPEVSDENA